MAALWILACGPTPSVMEPRPAEPLSPQASQSGVEVREPEMSLEQARILIDDAEAPAETQAWAQRRLGDELASEGRLEDAVDRYEVAVELLAEEPSSQALVLNELSGLYFRLGDYERQEAAIWRALEQAATSDDQVLAASAWNNLGVSYAARGRPSAALAAYHRCLELRRDLDDALGVASTRHNLGVQQLMLGRVDEGVEDLQQAVAARRNLNDIAALGRSLASLAWGLALDGRQEPALEAYAEAISVLEQVEAVLDLAIALEQRAQFYRGLARLQEAREDLERALELLTSSDGAPPLDAAYLRLGLSALRRQEAGTGGLEEVVAELRSAVRTFDALDAQDGRILARLELARALRKQGDRLDETTAVLEAAITIVETARAELRLSSFRATFLGGWQAVYQELVDLLAAASLEASPAEAQNLAARALEVAERARARALLDRLEAPSAEPVTGTEAWRTTQAEVEALETQALLEPSNVNESGGRGAGDSAGLARAALRQARFELERAQEASEQARPPSPVARPASFGAIRRELDEGTVLWVYALAPGRSWRWRVDSQGLGVTALPPGPEIEAASRLVHQLVPLQHKLGYRKAAAEALERLAAKVLDPEIGELEGDKARSRRLVIVPDGALHLVPFAALPVGERGTLLDVGDEVVSLPSASTLVALRRRASRPPASKLMAIVVDPVFEAEDPRLGGTSASGEGRPSVARTRQAIGGRLSRLPASAEEGSRIAAIAQRASGESARVVEGFDARRELITDGALADYSILHFATHGVVDAEDPALAGLVLSLYDEDGRPRDGLLRVRDLQEVRLAADLVVLSACRTALGQEIRGEGLVGLADGFFAAGAEQLIVSLWDVDDRATAELMVRFYHHLLGEGQGPAGALREAQQELRAHTEWRSPAYWAAFVAVGDWRVQPVVQR